MTDASARGAVTKTKAALAARTIVRDDAVRGAATKTKREFADRDAAMAMTKKNVLVIRILMMVKEMK